MIIIIPLKLQKWRWAKWDEDDEFESGSDLLEERQIQIILFVCLKIFLLLKVNGNFTCTFVAYFEPNSEFDFFFFFLKKKK